MTIRSTRLSLKTLQELTHPSFPGRLGDQGQVQDLLSIDLRSLVRCGLNRRT